MRYLFCLLMLGGLAGASTGCAEMRMVGLVTATPFTAIRDTVDAPLTTVANWAEMAAQKTKPDMLTPSAGVGIGLKGPTAGISLNLTYFAMKPISWLFGGVDYILCRSLYPNFPEGISPWKKPDAPWSSLYYPGTRALWAEPEIAESKE